MTDSSDPSSFLTPVWKDGIFDGRVVFVTGGAGDICGGQTRALVSLGANACIIGRNAEKTEAAAKEIAKVRKGSKVLGLGNVDVRSFDSLKAAADRCVSELGAIDFVIAGAAGNFVAPISGLSPNGFRTVMEIDTIGTFNTIKATADHLVASAGRNPNPSSNGLTGGRFLAISATFHYTGVPFQAHVGAAKAGIDSLVASMAVEYGPFGVLSNIIAPGAIEGTEGMKRLSSSEQDKKARYATVPAGRWGTIRDVADATVYLFSAAGDHVNGHVLVVDGGGWRRQGAGGVGIDPGMKYPDYMLSGITPGNVKSGKREGRAKL